MKRTALGVAAAVLALSGSTAVVHAQNPMSFGIAAGATFPTGDALEGANTGFHGMVTLGMTPAMVPFGVRIDGMYHSIGADDVVGEATGQSVQILGATVNGMFSMPGMMTTSPYLIGGVGFYNQKYKSDQGDSDGQNDFGLNIGIGAKFNLSGFGTFAEVRYHTIFSGSDDDGGVDIGNTNFIPLTFGIMF